MIKDRTNSFITEPTKEQLEQMRKIVNVSDKNNEPFDSTSLEVQTPAKEITSPLNRMPEVYENEKVNVWNGRRGKTF